MSSTTTNAITTTTTAPIYTEDDMRIAGNKLAAILNAPADHTAQERIDAELYLQTVTDFVNADKLSKEFSDFDHASNPLHAFAERRFWNPVYMRRTSDKTTKRVSFSLTSRRQRLNVLDYLKHAEDNSITLPESVDTLRKLLTAASKTLSDYVLSCIRDDKISTVSVSNVKAGLHNFMSHLGIDNLKVRNQDVRFLAMAVTHARDLGELAEIDAPHVAPYLMDMVHVQKEELKYGFAGKEAKKEQATK